MNKDPSIEHQIVDLILGETNDSAEADNLDQQLESRPELESFRDGISQLDNLLKKSAREPEVAPNGTWRMNSSRRDALIEKLSEAPPRLEKPPVYSKPTSRRKSRPYSKTTNALTAAALVFLAISATLFWKQNIEKDSASDFADATPPITKHPVITQPSITTAPTPTINPVSVQKSIDQPVANILIQEDSPPAQDFANENITSAESYPTASGLENDSYANTTASGINIDSRTELKPTLSTNRVADTPANSELKAPPVISPHKIKLNHLDTLIQIEHSKIQQLRIRLKQLSEVSRLQQLTKQVKDQISESEKGITLREKLLIKLQSAPDSLELVIKELDNLKTNNPAPTISEQPKPGPRTSAPIDELSILSVNRPSYNENQTLEYKHSLLAKLKIERQQLADYIEKAQAERELPELEESRLLQITLSNHLNSNLSKCRELEAKIRKGADTDRPIDVSELIAKIVAVNADWNFAMIDVGSYHGLTEGIEVLVYREKRIISSGRIIDLQEQFTLVTGLKNSMIGDQVKFKVPVIQKQNIPASENQMKLRH